MLVVLFHIMENRDPAIDLTNIKHFTHYLSLALR